jgi:drug/metabolite transporter (DMT)-like permease
MFFGEWPDRLALMGAAIIVGTGAFTLYRQQASRRVKSA